MKTLITYQKILFCTIFLFYSSMVCAQYQKSYSFEHYVVESDTLNYRMLLPNNFDASKQYPLVLFLHGAGERGSDNEKQLVHGSNLFVENRASFPAIVIFPQCPQNDYWANATIDRTTKPISLNFPLDMEPTKSLQMVMDLMDTLLSKPYVNKSQVYVGGLSMGGMGTFEMLYRKPELFAAAFTICGAGNPEATKKYAQTTPMWIFHGANDDVVNPQASIDMVSGILKYGGKPNFILYAKDNHNSWDSAFAEPELLTWLFSNSKPKQ